MATQLELLPKKLKKLGFDSYKDYLKSEHWINLRKRFYNSKKVKKMKEIHNKVLCEFCYGNENLNLHHRTYKRIGNERLDDLVVVCKECHYHIHQFYFNEMKIKNLYKATKIMRRIKKKNMDIMYELFKKHGFIDLI